MGEREVVADAIRLPVVDGYVRITAREAIEFARMERDARDYTATLDACAELEKAIEALAHLALGNRQPPPGYGVCYGRVYDAISNLMERTVR